MTDQSGTVGSVSRRERARAVVAWSFMALRVLVVVVLATVLFLSIPRHGNGFAGNGEWVAIFLAGLSLLIAMAVWLIQRSRYAVVRSMEALLIIIAIYLICFARFYLSASARDPLALSEPLDHMKALYFTVSTFATVGYGDITPNSDAMRLAATVQMLMNLALLSGVARLIFTAARRPGVAAEATTPSS